MTRIEKECEVLAALLLSEYAYKDLPEDFSPGNFETSDYRMLYELLQKDYISKQRPIKVNEIILAHPELKPLFDNIMWGKMPSNGTIRSKVLVLKNHFNYADKEDYQHIPILRTDKKADSKFKFESFNGKEICEMEIPEQSFLITNLISECSVNFLSGEEGCGKSLLAMNMALSIAIGAKYWLSYEIIKPGKVLFLNNELAFNDFARRLKQMGNALPFPGDISNLIVPKEVPSLNDCLDSLNEICEKENPCLLVIDCLYFTHNKDENDSSQMKALMRQFLTLRDKHNLALLLVHHTKKGARYQQMHNDQMRGSNVFGGITDTVLQFRRSANDESKRIIKPTKFRHVSDEYRKCRLLSLNPESLWFKDEGETNESEHIAKAIPTAEEEINFQEIIKPDEEVQRKDFIERCKSLGYKERTIDRCLSKAKDKGSIITSRYGHFKLKETLPL